MVVEAMICQFRSAMLAHTRLLSRSFQFQYVLLQTIETIKYVAGKMACVVHYSRLFGDSNKQREIMLSLEVHNSTSFSVCQIHIRIICLIHTNFSGYLVMHQICLVNFTYVQRIFRYASNICLINFTCLAYIWYEPKHAANKLKCPSYIFSGLTVILQFLHRMSVCSFLNIQCWKSF